jgi:hypothetical protein
MNSDNLTLVTPRATETFYHDGEYYHLRVGQVRTTAVTTSLGEQGTLKMLFVKRTAEGCLYKEWLWLNGALAQESETLVDNNNFTIRGSSKMGRKTLTIQRM